MSDAQPCSVTPDASLVPFPRRWPRRVLLAAGASLAALPARAQDALPRTITLMVPFSAGSIVDLTARAFADPLRSALGGDVQVVVVNREVAAGTIAATAVARARPDGATLGFGPIGILATQPHLMRDLGYTLADFDLLCQTFENIFVLAVRADSPHATLPALLAAARAAPERISWGDAGIGTIPNLLMREIERTAGVRMTYAPYRNIGQMATDAQAGTIDVAISAWTSLRNMGLRFLAVAADERLPYLEGVPTLAELGFRVAARGFGGLWAPRGMAPGLKARIEAACMSAAADAGYQAFSARSGQLAVPLGSEPFSRRIRETEPVLAALVRALEIGAR